MVVCLIRAVQKLIRRKTVEIVTDLRYRTLAFSSEIGAFG